MNRNELVARVTAMYQARLNNDAATAIEFFNKNAEFRFANAGSDECSPPLDQLVADWEWVTMSELNPIVDGNRVAVMYSLKVRCVPTGAFFETELFDHITFDEDGKVVEFVEFVDMEMLRCGRNT